MIIITGLLVWACVRLLWSGSSMSYNRAYWEQRDLEKTWRNMSPEGKAQVYAHYQQMKSEGRI